MLLIYLNNEASSPRTASVMAYEAISHTRHIEINVLLTSLFHPTGSGQTGKFLRYYVLKYVATYLVYRFKGVSLNK